MSPNRTLFKYHRKSLDCRYSIQSNRQHAAHQLMTKVCAKGCGGKFCYHKNFVMKPRDVQQSLGKRPPRGHRKTSHGRSLVWTNIRIQYRLIWDMNSLLWTADRNTKHAVWQASDGYSTQKQFTICKIRRYSYQLFSKSLQYSLTALCASRCSSNPQCQYRFHCVNINYSADTQKLALHNSSLGKRNSITSMEWYLNNKHTPTVTVFITPIKKS